MAEKNQTNKIKGSHLDSNPSVKMIKCMKLVSITFHHIADRDTPITAKLYLEKYLYKLIIELNVFVVTCE